MLIVTGIIGLIIAAYWIGHREGYEEGQDDFTLKPR